MDLTPPGIGAPVAAVFTRVETFDSIAAARRDWQCLEATAPASPYQTLAWAEAWCDTRAVAEGLKPCIIVAYDADETPAALLPFVRQIRAGLRTITFLGGKDSNANLGLFANPEQWDTAAVQRLLAESAKRAGLDLFILRNQPALWDGHRNPLLLLGRQPSPSSSRMAMLDQDLSTRLSKHARKALRQKDARLRQLGTVEHRVARTRDEADAIVEAYVLQKTARADATGIATPSTSLTNFLRNASLPHDDRTPAIELHSLVCGSEILATFAGAGHRGRFSGMVIAFDQRSAFARCSPGDLLIAAMMTDLRARGFSSFDLGIGEARYKETFCDTVEPLYDSIIGTTIRGGCASAVIARLLRAKGIVKRASWAVSSIKRLRASANRIRSALTVTRP